MIDALIIAFVLVAVALAARSIAKSFSTNRCSGCHGSGCSADAHACPLSEATVSHLDDDVAQRLAAQKGSRA